MALQTIGSLQVNDIVAIQSRPAGTLSFGPANLPAGFSILAVTFDLRQVTSLTAAFTATVELSLNTGGTWADIGSSGLDLAKSGYLVTANVLTRSATDPLGPGPVRVFAQSFQIPNTDLTTRQIRGSVSCTEVAISGVTVMAW